MPSFFLSFTLSAISVKHLLAESIVVNLAAIESCIVFIVLAIVTALKKMGYGFLDTGLPFDSRRLSETWSQFAVAALVMIVRM